MGNLFFGGNFFDFFSNWQAGDNPSNLGNFAGGQLGRWDINNYQHNKMQKYFQKDHDSFSNSLDRHFMKQSDDFNGRNSQNRYGGSNIHQGRNRNSVNMADAGGKGKHNILQHGGRNAAQIDSGKKGFIWQGAGDNSRNVAEGKAENNTAWQRGKDNAFNADGEHNEAWQGGYGKSENYFNGGSDNFYGTDKATQVSGDGGTNKFVGGDGHNTGVQQVDYGKSTYDGSDRNGSSKITQRGDGGKKNYFGSDYSDKATFKGDNSKINAKLGGGDDVATIKGSGNTGKLDGGSGYDTLKLDGKLNDYDVSYKYDNNKRNYTFSKDGKDFTASNFENFKVGGKSMTESDMHQHGTYNPNY